MGWRNKKADLTESKEIRIVALPPLQQQEAVSAESPNGENALMEMALPSLCTIKPLYRHLGYFQGRKVWEASLGFSYFH